MLAGGLSPHGTMGQGGNVYEWEETEFDMANNSVSSPRTNRGGSWAKPDNHLSVLIRIGSDPATEGDAVGFRVASLAIPEPSSILLGVWAAVGLLLRRRR